MLPHLLETRGTRNRAGTRSRKMRRTRLRKGKTSVEYWLCHLISYLILILHTLENTWALAATIDLIQLFFVILPFLFNHWGSKLNAILCKTSSQKVFFLWNQILKFSDGTHLLKFRAGRWSFVLFVPVGKPPLKYHHFFIFNNRNNNNILKCN